jgi:hypothetical protein
VTIRAIGTANISPAMSRDNLMSSAIRR